MPSKWKSESFDRPFTPRGGTSQTLVIFRNPSMGISVPLHRGIVMTREEWAALRGQIDTFFHRAYDECESVASPDEAPITPIDAINRMRLWRQRRVVEECTGGGYVYFLRGEQFCKIGQTTNLNQRLKTLKIQLPFKVDLFHAIPTATPVALEKQFHEKFKDKRANGEWFKLEEQDYTHIKTWNRAYSSIDAAIESLPHLVPLAFIETLRDYAAALGMADDGSLYIDPGEANARIAELLGQLLSRNDTEILELLQGAICEECGTEAGTTHLYAELEAEREDRLRRQELEELDEYRREWEESEESILSALGYDDDDIPD